MAAEGAELSDAGYRYLKIKLKGDVRRCRPRARDPTRGRRQVRLTVTRTSPYGRGCDRGAEPMAEFDIDLAEQPIAAADHEGLKR
jgi:hypothetical protein